MSKEMLINVSEGEECRIALLENDKVEEFYIERTSATSHVGNIYKGRVVNVEASIQAAFVDFGLGRNGFLHISDLLPTYFGQGEDFTETVGRKLARRDRPPIQRCLRRGDEIIVQIIKEGIGTKGPTLTTYLSIPGRIIVMMPGMSKMGVSRKIEDEVERKRLRQILDQLQPPQDCGFIIRTAGIGRPKADIQRDLAYLTRLWQQVLKKMESGTGPMTLYTEGDLVTRTVRDIFTTEIDRIIIDNERVAEQVRDFVKLTSPRAKDKVELYTDSIPLFHKFNIENDIEMMNSRHVPLPSGGSLVIDQTEAVVAIDVNSGKFRDHSDAETTAFKTDMEAAAEIPRQLKLRDLGGVIICDFIDLRYDRHRRELEQKLHDAFKSDRAKTKVLRMSQFGIIEITRQRMRPSVKRSIYCDCPHCRGSGLVKTPESMSLDVMRKLAIATQDQRVARAELTVHSDVAHYLNNRKRFNLAELENITGKTIVIRTGDVLGLDEVRFELFDARDGVVMIDELLSHAPQTIQEAQTMAMQARQHGARPERRDIAGPNAGVHAEEHGDRFEREDFDDEPEVGGQGSMEPFEEGPGTDDGEFEGQHEALVDTRESSRPEPRRAPIQPPQQRPLPQRPPQAPQAPRQQQQQQSQQPSRPFQTAQQGQAESDFDGEESRGGRRRRGRRGRGGRDRFEGQPQTNVQQPMGEVEQETVGRLPSQVRIQMSPAANIQQKAPMPMPMSPRTAQAAQAPAPVRQSVVQPQASVSPRRPIEEVRPAPIQEYVEMPRSARKPFKSNRTAQSVQPPQPARLIEMPQSAARIAEWSEVPALKRPAKVKSAVAPAVASKPAAKPVEEPKNPKRKPSVAKPAAKVAAKSVAKPAAKASKSVAKPAVKKPVRATKKAGNIEEANISVGTAIDAATEMIGVAADDPKVRVADVPSTDE